MFSVTVFYDERIVIVAEQRPDASEEDSFQWMSRVLQVHVFMCARVCSLLYKYIYLTTEDAYCLISTIGTWYYLSFHLFIIYLHLSNSPHTFIINLHMFLSSYLSVCTF